MEEKKEIYRGKAVAVKDAKQTAKALLKAALFCGIMFAISVYIPFGWIIEIGAIALSAVYINKVLKQGTFIATYVLYEDSLVVLTRYGFIEKETERYSLADTVFTEKTVTSNGKTRPFYPDEELIKILKKRAASPGTRSDKF